MPENKKEDFYSFEEVVKELKLTEEELKRMVSEGELLAFQDVDEIKFKKEDIDNLKGVEVTDSTKDEISIGEDTSSITEELPFEQAEVNVPAGEEKSDSDIENIGIVTTPLNDGEETLVDETIAEDEAAGSEEFTEKATGKTRGSKRLRPSTITKSKPIQLPSPMMPMIKLKVHPIFIGLLAAILIVLMFVGAFLGDIIRISSDKTKSPAGITNNLGNIVVKIFSLKDETGTKKIELDK